MANFTIPEAQTTQYSIERYEWRDGGVMQAPIAVNGDPVPCAILRLHAPRELIAVAWSAERWGAPPIVPHPDTLEGNAIFLKGWRGAVAPKMSPELKGQIWFVEGVYIYAKRAPTGLASNLPTGRIPFDIFVGTPNDNTIGAGNFQSQILGTYP